MTDIEDVMMTSAQVCARYGSITPMTLYRWVNDERLGFPQAMRINNVRYWKASEILAWERARASRSLAAA